MTRALFMARENKLKMRRVIDGVENGEDGTSGVTEDVFYAMANHHFVKDLTTRHPNKGVVKGALWVRTQGWGRKGDTIPRGQLLESWRRGRSAVVKLRRSGCGGNWKQGLGHTQSAQRRPHGRLSC